MRTIQLWLLPLAALLVSGCPHNEYVLTLTPRGEVLKRQLVFYRVDQGDTNKPPAYEQFPAAERATIERVYQNGTVSRDGERTIATAEFRGTLPDDIGGSGTYTNLATILGNAGFYVERFRGEQDFATGTEQRFHAADELVDLALGWSRAEFGREEHSQDLHRFLDGDVRRDLKNLGLYWWIGEISSTYKSGAAEEFAVRFGELLADHGYFKPADVPGMFSRFQRGGDESITGFLRQWIMKKLQRPDASPVPAALADSASLSASWERFLVGTSQYQAKIRKWENDRIGKPDLKKPAPDEVTDDLVNQLLQLGGPGEDDRLTVELLLPSPPLHTNGEWNESGKKLHWENRLAPRDNSPVGLPGFGYATWVEPDEAFQKKHLGRVAVREGDLLEYCLWRAGLPGNQGAEWDAFLQRVRPGEELIHQLQDFRFSGEPRSTPTNAPAPAVSSAFARDLLVKGIGPNVRQ